MVQQTALPVVKEHVVNFLRKAIEEKTIVIISGRKFIIANVTVDATNPNASSIAVKEVVNKPNEDKCVVLPYLLFINLIAVQDTIETTYLK